MDSMNLSDGEKLILLMLCEIQERLEIKGEIDPSFVKDALFGGHYWALKDVYWGLLNLEERQPAMVEEVFDILNMWLFLERSYEQLSEQDKDRIKTEAKGLVGRDVKFQGFDGNNESEYMATAEFIVEKMERFTHFKGRYFNSHSPSLQLHRPMVQAFQEIRSLPQIDLSNLNVEQIITIVNAKWTA